MNQCPYGYVMISCYFCAQTIELGRTKPVVSVKSASDSEPAAVDMETSVPTDISVSELSQNDVEDDADTQDELMGSDQLKPLRLELTPESQLDSTEPVCVELLDCAASVKEVLKWLTSASW